MAGSILLLALIVPALATAACSAAQRADARAARSSLDALAASGAAGHADARAIYARARRNCDDLQFARAIAEATLRLGAPASGARARLRGIDLIGHDLSGAVVWRIDVAGLAERIIGARTPRAAAAARARLQASSFGMTARTFSADPTLATWDAITQSLVIATLTRSRSALDRRTAGAGVRAWAAPGRSTALTTLPLLEHVRIVNRAAIAADRSASPASRVAAGALALRAYGRIRGAQQRGWSRIDGRWSTGAEHRALVTQALALLRRVPHPATSLRVARLAAANTTAPAVAYSTLPRAEFYPWPRDGAFDTQALTVDVNKPAQLRLAVYAPAGTVVRVIEASVEPGTTTLTWDGAAGDGAIVAAGDYRYNLDATDLLANHVRVAGLEQFRVARDTAPPKVASATARWIVAGGNRRLVASWDVTEVHSPQVRTWLLLQQGERRESLQLHDSLQKASVRRPMQLATGTWSASFVFIDGSGNRASTSAGSILVR